MQNKTKKNGHQLNFAPLSKKKLNARNATGNMYTVCTPSVSYYYTNYV